MLLSENCGLVSVGCPLWQEDESAICSVITQWSKLLRTRNHTLLSHLRLPQPGGPGSHIYIPQEQGGPVIPRALSSLNVISYDSQGHSGGILTLPLPGGTGPCIYRVFQEKCARLQEGVPYGKVYRYNPKHLCPKLNGYGDNGQRKVRSSGRSIHCTCQVLTSAINACP
jgi:hypothetical protein